MNGLSKAIALTAAVVALSGCGSDNNIAMPSVGSSVAECGGRGSLSAEGSTAQQNAIAVFNQVWGQKCPGKNLSYNPTGSGAGINQFVANQVDFAGSDSPLSTDQTDQAVKRCGGNPVWNLPLVFGPVALVYNVPGTDRIILTADLLAKIFTGVVTNWNDPAIMALNPVVVLPNTAIIPVYRSDSSGTTDNFQKYLGIAAPHSWTKGAGKEFQGGAGEGAQKSAGVMQAVQATPGSIGYVEKGFAAQAGLPMARIDTGSGPVEPTDDAAGKTIESAQFAGDGNDLALDLNSIYGTTVPGAYPLVLATYEVVCSRGYGADTAAAVRSFLSVAVNDGQAGLAVAGYSALPPAFAARVLSAVGAIGA